VHAFSCNSLTHTHTDAVLFPHILIMHILNISHNPTMNSLKCHIISLIICMITVGNLFAEVISKYDLVLSQKYFLQVFCTESDFPQLSFSVERKEFLSKMKSCSFSYNKKKIHF